MSSDISPPLAWSDAPEKTKSFVMLMTDPDAINSPYFDLPKHYFAKDAPRVTVYQWILVNIPAETSSLPEGAGSKGYVVGGKPVGKTPYGLTGMNIYTEATKSQYASRIEPGQKDPKKAEGVYGGYDGGCPPWNDSMPHHYTFTLYALDVEDLGLPESGKFDGKDVVNAMKGHILGQAEIVALYSTNPTVIKKERCPCRRYKIGQK